jgi:hypothetical protein
MMSPRSIPLEALALALVAVAALVVALRASSSRAMPRRAVVALVVSLLPSLAFFAEYVPRMVLESVRGWPPAPHECVTFFPALLGLLVGPVCLVVALLAARRTARPALVYAALALASVSWLGSTFFLLDGLVTLT